MPRRTIALIAVFLGIHLFAKWQTRPPIGAPKDAVLGDAQPFTASGLDGQPVTLQAFSKSHPLTVLVFMESWCEPCNAEMPALRALDESYKRRGVGLVGVYRQSTRDAMRAMAAQYQTTFPMLEDPSGKIFADFAVQSVPTTIVVDEQMQVVRHTPGPDRDLPRFVEGKLGPVNEESL